MSFSTWAIENGKIIEYTCTSNQGQAEYEKNKGGRYNDQGKKPVLSGCNEVNKNVIVGYNNTVSGYYVKVLQMALVAVDHQNSDVSCHPGEVDSLFGANTYNATKAYQQYNNRLSLLYSGINRIDVDGYCGPATWTSLSLVCH